MRERECCWTPRFGASRATLPERESWLRSSARPVTDLAAITRRRKSMIDPEKAAMAGLVRPTLVICERCHENEEPGHRGTFLMPEQNQWTRWIHEMKSR